MLTSFIANTESACASDRSAGITTSGAYVGVFKQAETYKSMGGAQMLRFWFSTKEGQETWIDLCILKKNGEAAFGMDLFNALMVCMGVTNADATPGKARMRNGQINDNAYRIKGVEQKPIGLVLQRENDRYQDPRTGEMRDTFRMNIVRGFEPNSRKTASELIQGKEAHNVENLLKTLKDRDRTGGQAAAQQTAAPAQPAQAAPAQDFDDCPF